MKRFEGKVVAITGGGSGMGKLSCELFAAEGDMVPCPVCGTMHPAQEKCVTCALDAAFGGTEAREKLVPKE